MKNSTAIRESIRDMDNESDNLCGVNTDASNARRVELFKKINRGWADHKRALRDEAREAIPSVEDQIASMSTPRKKSTKRVKVQAGSVSEGDRLNGAMVTGLGRIWTERVNDTEACVYGMQPGADNHVAVQYAYCA